LATSEPQVHPENILMKRLMALVVVAGTATLAACGGGEVVVQAFLQQQEGQAQALSNLPVRALPYDRDAIFDSLRAAYGTPEPEIPAELTALQDSISAANQAWSQANARWAAGRDSLRAINDRMQGLPRMNPQYIVLFNQFNALESQVNALQRSVDQAFNRFTALQTRYTTRADEVRNARDQWADAAYADVDRIISARLREQRLTEVVDTTGPNGVARLSGLRGGRPYWIHARYDLPFEELYWNVAVPENREGTIQLTRENAERRPKL
jgi:hypothetical protein